MAYGGENGYANPDGPAVSSNQSGGKGVEYVLPKASVTVLRGLVQWRESGTSIPAACRCPDDRANQPDGVCLLPPSGVYWCLETVV